MSINDLNNLYDTIVNENKLSESEELNDRVKSLMLLIKRAHEKSKRSVVLPYLETDIKALLRKSNFNFEIECFPNGGQAYRIYW